MTTPLCDFVRAYAARQGARLHMPGHKGRGPLGVETLDITEIGGADELYHARGVIRESEENASSLFGTARTLYSAEGSSLCVRAMVYLALLEARERGRAPRLLAARNAHKTLMTAAALLGVEIDWLLPPDGSLLRCLPDPADLDARLSAETPMAVYITSPDYLGHCADVAALAAVCHAHGVPLLVDNAHGAYLRFLPRDRHPISLGADLCCDSAHKTLPCLTGTAYLHIGRGAPASFGENAEAALALFASTSPSYLLLYSLDAANPLLAGAFPARLAACVERTEALRQKLRDHGFALAGEEPMKITLAPKAFGYTGEQVHDALRRRGIECEFADPDALVLMPSPSTPDAHWALLEEALLTLPRRAPLAETPPPLPAPERVLSLREALLAPRERLPLARCLGRVLADAHAGCPPAVPILTAGERITAAALRCMQYYGKEDCMVVREGEKQ